MTRSIRTTPALLAALLSATTVLADPLFGPARDDAPQPRDSFVERHHPGFGARVGGYGFRNDDGTDGWDDCRMNGAGIFGTLDASRHVFGELSLDAYQATAEEAAHGMERDSLHTLAGVGLRMAPDFVVTPFVQLGAGVEWTRIEQTAAAAERVYPMGYFGLGAALRVTREFELGAMLRTLATAHAHDHEPAEGTASHGHALGVARHALSGEGEAEPRVETKPDIAAQGQFFLRYAL